jgi:murein DD-endopeptidase MepM/ murein hydrolase activator NlpD
MQRMSTIEQSQNHAVASIGQHARQSAKILRTTLAQTGLNEQRFAAHHPSQADTSAEDGPLIELATDPNGSAFERSLHDMRQDIMSAQYLIANLPSLPLRAPLIRNLEQTSPFGMRIDPFTGRYAMHTGIDLRDGIGTPVRSTAAGIVIFAGTSGGYGNMVEIDHGHGLTTRYGHLQSIIVHEGEHVSFGSFIGQLGSTGRSTGPHLHYEVRIDGEAVDPTRFLSSGRYLYHS